MSRAFACIKLALRSCAFFAYLVVMVIGLLEFILRFGFSPESVKTRIQMNELARAPEQTQISLYDYKNLRFKPNTRGKILHQEYSNEASHDQLGFRNPCFEFGRAMTAVLVGDSFSYGIGVNDSETFGCQLNTAETSSEHFYTLGIPGTAPLMYVNMLERHHDDLMRLAENNRPVETLVMVFLGNDYEEFLELPSMLAKTLPGTTDLATRPAEVDFITSLATKVNRFVFHNSVMAKSYAFQALKLIALRLSTWIRADAKAFVNYGGTVFYDRGTPLREKEATASIRVLRERLSHTGFAVVGLVLIPDPAEIDAERLKRDGSIAGYDVARTDVNHKFDTLLSACRETSMTCVDSRTVLTSADYYVSDNHLRPSGVRAISSAIGRALKHIPTSTPGPSSRR